MNDSIDDPKEAEPATPKERAAILDKLARYVTTDSVLSLDGEQRRGKLNKQQLRLPFSHNKRA